MKTPTCLKATFAVLCIMVLSILGAGCDGTGPSAGPLDPEAYASTMAAWFETHWLGNYQEAEEKVFKDPLHPTQAEVASLQLFADKLKTSLEDLQAVTPPEEIARVHRQFAADWSEQMDLLQEMAHAAKAGDMTTYAETAAQAQRIIEDDTVFLEALIAYIDAHFTD